MNAHLPRLRNNWKSQGLLLLLIVLTAAPVMAAERMAVKSDIANIRSGPGTKYDVLWQVEKYHPLIIVKKSGEWYQFKDFEGDRGWIHKSLLDKTRTVITQKNDCNVRSGPGTKNRILFTAEKGIPFKVLSKKGKWYHIMHADGDKGWIYGTLVW